MKDHPDARCRIEILARIAAWSTLLLQQAESQAELSTDDVVDVHWAADLDVARASCRSSDAVPALDLQIARLAWVHHTISRTRRETSLRAQDPAATVISTVVQLLKARQDCPVVLPARKGAHVCPSDLQLIEGLRALGEAADRMARLLRQHRTC